MFQHGIMSVVRINPAIARYLRKFSTLVTWGISPRVLREKAQRGPENAPHHCWKISGASKQISLIHEVSLKKKNCHRLVGKGEGRAKPPCRGLRKVSSARQNRKHMA